MAEPIPARAGSAHAWRLRPCCASSRTAGSLARSLLRRISRLPGTPNSAATASSAVPERARAAATSPAACWWRVHWRHLAGRPRVPPGNMPALLAHLDLPPPRDRTAFASSIRRCQASGISTLPRQVTTEAGAAGSAAYCSADRLAHHGATTIKEMGARETLKHRPGRIGAVHRRSTGQSRSGSSPAATHERKRTPRGREAALPISPPGLIAGRARPGWRPRWRCAQRRRNCWRMGGRAPGARSSLWRNTSRPFSGS